MKELVLDVSKWDGDMSFSDWKKKRNLYGVIIKGGGSDVGRYIDSWFARNYDKCVAAGVHIGAYWYSKALTVAEAKADAKYFIDNCLSGRAWDLPLYIDVEEQAIFDLGKRKATDVCKAFMDALGHAGYKAGIYTGGFAWNGYLNGDAELADYADWIAAWASNPPAYIRIPYGMWQQGGIRLSDGHIVYDDKPGYHDCDWALIDYPAMLNGGAKITQEAVPETTTPTGTVEAVMTEAYADLGYYAPDDPERGSKAGRYCAKLMGEDWMAGPSVEIWWCCMWVSMILDKAHVRCAGFPSQNTDVALNNGARAHLVDKNQIRRGDVLIFDWNFATQATDHIGFATGSPYGGYVNTIEGNVGNAVKEKQRALSTIRYVVRPDYEGQVATQKKDVVKPDYEAALEIDGSAGHLTIHKWQEALGTYADGKISEQDADSYKYRHNVYSIEHTRARKGSPMVKVVQRVIGAYPDGLWGEETSKKLQHWLVKKGYSIGDAGIDGYFGCDSVRALQKSINDGAWS